jgi:DNA-binding response OmpR family regulator
MKTMPAKILVADADADTCRLLGYLLGMAGHQVAVAAAGDEALLLQSRWRPDLLLLDVNLPVLSGLEVCRRLRADPHAAHMRIMFLSSRAMVTDRLAGLKSGADDYVVKPAALDEILVRVDALLGRPRSSHLHGPLPAGIAAHPEARVASAY